MTLGTGERLKRTTLPKGPPKKPERRGTPGHSPALQRKMETNKHEEEEAEEEEKENETQIRVEADPEPETAEETGETGLTYMNLNAEGEAESVEGKIDEPPWEGGDEESEGKDGGERREQAKDRRTSRRAKRQREKQEKDRERQEEKERRQKERERRLKEKSPTPERRLKEKSPTPERRLKDKSKSPTPEVSDSPALPPREKPRPLTDGEKEELREKEEEKEREREEVERDENAAKAAEVVMITKPSNVTACGQPISVVFDTRSAGEGSLTAVCKGTKTEAVETSVQEELSGHYCIQFTPSQGDMFMLSVLWSGHNVPGSPFLINLNLLPPAENTSLNSNEDKGEEGEKEVEQSDGPREDIATQPRGNGLGKEGEGGEVIKNAQEEVPKNSANDGSRETSPGVKSPVILVNDEDPFNMAYQASRMLGKSSLRLIRLVECSVSPHCD